LSYSYQLSALSKQLKNADCRKLMAVFKTKAFSKETLKEMLKAWSNFEETKSK
jgi:hypothetical protein